MVECKCGMRTKLIGDGCEVCNSELALEHAKNYIEELEDAIKNISSDWEWYIKDRYDNNYRVVSKSIKDALDLI